MPKVVIQRLVKGGAMKSGPKTKLKPGPKTKYKKEYNKLGSKLAAAGFTDSEMAEMFQVSRSTLSLWKSKHVEFRESLSKWKKLADDRVEKTLYERALGTTVKEVKTSVDGNVTTIKQVPGDVTAMIFWLKNRNPAEWRDRHIVDSNVEITVNRKEYTKI